MYVSISFSILQLTPVEKYAMKFLESSDDGWAAEAERMAAEIEQQKKEWELERLQALKEEEERMAHNSDEEILTYSSVDAHNQVNIKNKKGSEKGQSGTQRGGQYTKNRPAFHEQPDEYSSTESDTSLSDSEDEDASDSGDSWSSSEEAFNSSRKKLKGGRQTEGTDKMVDGDSQSASPPSKVVFNKVSEDSPRTRSRGRVKINLWTLDVNPVLPGERPVPFSRKQLANLREKGLTIPRYEGSDSPFHSEDRSRNNSGQTMNGDIEEEKEGEGEDMEVDVVGDSGDSTNVDGTHEEANSQGESLEDVTGSLKANGLTPLTVHNGVGL